MRTFVILLNFLLISLIMYYFLSKTNKVIENLEGCPADKKNLVYKTKADLERLFSELNRVKTEVAGMKIAITTNSMLAKLNAQQSKSVSTDINSEKDKKIAELDALDKKYEGEGGW